MHSEKTESFKVLSLCLTFYKAIIFENINKN